MKWPIMDGGRHLEAGVRPQIPHSVAPRGVKAPAWLRRRTARALRRGVALDLREAHLAHVPTPLLRTVPFDEALERLLEIPRWPPCEIALGGVGVEGERSEERRVGKEWRSRWEPDP